VARLPRAHLKHELVDVAGKGRVAGLGIIHVALREAGRLQAASRSVKCSWRPTRPVTVSRTAQRTRSIGSSWLYSTLMVMAVPSGLTSRVMAPTASLALRGTVTLLTS